MKLQTIFDHDQGAYASSLRRPASQVDIFDSGLKKYVVEMYEVMKRHNGLGLAAPQVNIDKRLIVFGYEPKGKDDIEPIPFMALANPRITRYSKEKETMNEGCLSLPGLELPVTRSIGVTVEAQQLDGRPITIRAKGMLARILQHEIDHLDGVLFTDRADTYEDIADYRWARIVFFGSDEFSLPVLRCLAESGLNIIAVVTETDKPSGRGRGLKPTPVKTESELLGLTTFQPEDKAEITSLVEQLQPDLIVLASYGKILPKEALSASLYGGLNVHPSLLPKYRGATPIQTAILEGENETGVTIMVMASGVDTGSVTAQDSETIKVNDTSETLRVRLSAKGAALLLRSLPPYLAGKAIIVQQDPSLVTETTKLHKEMGEIDWSKPLATIDREIRAFQPWPGAYTFVDSKRLKVLGSYIEGSKLKLGMVQLEGKRPTNWEDFRRGHAQALKKSPWYGRIG